MKWYWIVLIVVGLPAVVCVMIFLWWMWKIGTAL